MEMKSQKDSRLFSKYIAYFHLIQEKYHIYIHALKMMHVVKLHF